MPSPSPTTIPQTPPPADKASLSTWIAITAGAVGAFMAILSIQITNASLLDIEGGIGTGVDNGAWISTSYLIGEIIVIPLTGSVALAGCRRAPARCLPIRPRGRTPGGRGPAAPACRWRARHAPVPWPASPSPRRRPASAARSQSSETRASALSGA